MGRTYSGYGDGMRTSKRVRSGKIAGECRRQKYEQGKYLGLDKLQHEELGWMDIGLHDNEWQAVSGDNSE